MKTVSQETIDDHLKSFSEMDETAFESLCDEIRDKQPYVVTYLMGNNDLMAEEGHESQIMQLGVFVYLVLSEANPNLQEVNDEQLDTAEEKNIEFLGKMDAGSEQDFAAAVEKQHSQYNQKYLLGVLLESLMADHAENPEQAPESIGMEFLCLKTIIDCLDQ